jgi:putative acetyltransferase
VLSTLSITVQSGTGSRFTIRRALPVDAGQIGEAHVDSIHSLGAKAYGPDVVSVWGAPKDIERYRQSMESAEVFFVAVAVGQADDRVLGFSSYRMEEGKHRTAVYVRGEAARMGVGTALFQAAEATAREHGASEIHVDSSVGAVGFYKSLGFEELGAGQHCLSSGLLMDCVFMRKTLER